MVLVEDQHLPRVISATLWNHLSSPNISGWSKVRWGPDNCGNEELEFQPQAGKGGWLKGWIMGSKYTQTWGFYSCFRRSLRIQGLQFSIGIQELRGSSAAQPALWRAPRYPRERIFQPGEEIELLPTTTWQGWRRSIGSSRQWRQDHGWNHGLVWIRKNLKPISS